MHDSTKILVPIFITVPIPNNAQVGDFSIFTPTLEVA